MNDQLVCRICSSSRLRERPFGYSFNGKWLQAWECLECSIIFIDPQPTAEELRELYSHEYFEGNHRCGHAGSYFDARSLATLEHNTRIAQIKALARSGRFLEIGCAGGVLLHKAQQEGYEVRGVEFSEEMAAFARQKYGLDVFAGELKDARFPSTTFDVVFMGDVLEHVADPIALMKEIHRITKPYGHLIIAIPSQTNTLFSRVGFTVYPFLGKKATVNLPPYHLFEYRSGSLRELTKRCRFDMTKLTQTIMAPGEIALRGSTLQNAGKKIAQYVNYLITKTSGVLGDRIEAIAVRQ